MYNDQFQQQANVNIRVSTLYVSCIHLNFNAAFTLQSNSQWKYMAKVPPSNGNRY